jgi:predicted amidohydrolase
MSIGGDLSGNINRHVAWVKAAAKHGAQYILFPELSLTGYELAIAHEMSVIDNDLRLNELRMLAQELNVTITVGAPYVGKERALHIAAFSFLPNGRTVVYTKQHLHAAEHNIFTQGEGGEDLNIQGQKIALAVCADLSCPNHAKRAADKRAAVYAASVLITDKGYDADVGLLKRYATDYQMAVVMANHGATTGGWTPAGRSGFWNAGGELAIAAPGDGECMIIAELEGTRWSNPKIEAGI